MAIVTTHDFHITEVF